MRDDDVCNPRRIGSRVSFLAATGREHFACLDPIVTQIFILLISNGEKILSNMNVVGRGQVKSENSSLPVAVRVSKTRVLKLPTSVLFRGDDDFWFFD